MILLNQFPPLDPADPEMAFPVLQGYLKRNEIATVTHYWNLLLSPVYEKYFGDGAPYSLFPLSDQDVNESVFYLGPFLHRALRDKPTELGLERLAGVFLGMDPKKALFGKAPFSGFMTDFSDTIIKTLHQGLHKKQSELLAETVLWGFSFKYNQWLPGSHAARWIKRRHPNVKTVCGGFSSRDNAAALMEGYPEVDFAIWGEGEVPLKSLYQQLCSDEADFERVPQLLYRRAKDPAHILTSKAAKAPAAIWGRDDYSDYFKTLEQVPNTVPSVRLSYLSIRGCPWQGCSFCTLHQNAEYREKPPEQIVDEIRFLVEEYGITCLHFGDNSVAGKELARFEKLLDLLIDMRIHEDGALSLTADIIPLGLPLSTLKRMRHAGFELLLPGYEANCDSLLLKMHKTHTFAHNLWFLKFATSLGIQVNANILQGTPGETAEDVFESIYNLHFLRFYFNRFGRIAFWLAPMSLSRGTSFHSRMPPAEKKNWAIDDAYTIFSFTDHAHREGVDRFMFGSFTAPLQNKAQWTQLGKVLALYQEQRFDFQVFSRGDEAIAREFRNGRELHEFAFSQLEFAIMKAADECVISLSDLQARLIGRFPTLTHQALAEGVTSLKSDYLLYADKEMNTLLTIPHMGAVDSPLC